MAAENSDPDKSLGGGRAKAPMVRLISDAVLVAYGRSKPAGKMQLVVKAGQGLVRMPAGVVITSEEVANALEKGCCSGSYPPM